MSLLICVPCSEGMLVPCTDRCRPYVFCLPGLFRDLTTCPVIEFICRGHTLDQVSYDWTACRIFRTFYRNVSDFSHLPNGVDSRLGLHEPSDQSLVVTEDR